MAVEGIGQLESEALSVATARRRSWAVERDRANSAKTFHRAKIEVHFTAYYYTKRNSSDW